MQRDYIKEHTGVKHVPGTWPMYSDAAGVHPDQRKEAYEASVKQGCPTNFDALGRAVFTSQKHKKQYCEANGLYDRNGGYGDPQRGKRR